jgi:hypothetical protein
MANKEAVVKTESGVHATPSIEGNMIDLAAGETIAIYERTGECWVAEFRDGHGTLHYASSWFRFYAARLRAAYVARKVLTALTPETLDRIERLHAESEAQQERALAVPRAIATAAQRYLNRVTSRLRGGASKVGQTLG